MARIKREVPVLTDWSEAVDNVNYAKGTNTEVVKGGGKNHDTGSTYVPNKGAEPVFKYKNSRGNIGDWYAKTDVTEVVATTKASPKASPVKVVQKGFSTAQLAKIQALVQAGLL